MAERTPEQEAAEYRRMAAQCLEVAERMSLRDDRARIMEMAQQLLDFAQKAEAKAQKGG